MARPLRIEYSGAFYHVTSRGNERKPVFIDRRDREKFIGYLGSATERYGAIIHTYCLMGNHYHLLVETPLGNLSKIMHHINGAYTIYFNIRWKRIGHLFQGRYKAILVEADEYAKELSRYIHLNPVRANIVVNPEEYEWTSYPYYTVKHNPPEWLQLNFILGYFSNKRATAMKGYREFVVSAMAKEYENPLSSRLHNVILGSQDFMQEIKTRYFYDRQPDRDLPDLKELPEQVNLDDIEKIVNSHIKFNSKLSRQMKLYFSHRFSGLRLKEIGDRYGISESGVTQASYRMRLRMKNNKNIGGLIAKIEKKLKV